MKTTITFLLFALSLNISCKAQCNSELEQYSHGFENIKSNSFSFLDNALNDVRIIGYGEDTHGTAEFTILAKELMQYLAEKQEFKILIIETGFGEGQYLNDYIQGKNSDLKTIMNERNSTWRYRTEEFYLLMNWLRDYNQNNTDKIHLYGCEMQYVVSDVNKIIEYLKTVDSTYKIDGFKKQNIFQLFDESEKTDYFIEYAKLKNLFIDNYETFKNKTSERAFNLAYHQVEILGQFVTTINQNVEQRKSDFRDLYMAENIEWILNFHGHQSKALYWAHNAHIGDWVSNGNIDVAGHQLRRMYGNSYFNIATDFGKGEFIAFPFDANKTNDWNFKTFKYDKVLKNTFTYCLKQMGKPNTFVNLRKAKTNQGLKTYLEKDLTTMSGAGARVRNSETETNDIGKAFDGIIYLDKTSKINWTE